MCKAQKGARGITSTAADINRRGKPTCSPLGAGETQPSFLEAAVALLADDEVVEHFDIQKLPCFDNLLRHLHILGTGRGVS